MKRAIYLTLIFILSLFQIQAQENLWNKRQYVKTDLPNNLQNLSSFQTFDLKVTSLRSKLENLENLNIENQALISIPVDDEGLQVFKVREVSNFSKELQDKYPSIRSYRGFSVKNPEQSVSISMAGDDVKINLFLAQENIVIEPMAKGSSIYVKYNVNHLGYKEKFSCFTESKMTENTTVQRPLDIDDGVYRTYRLAVSTDGEFGSYFGGIQESLVGINNLLTIVNSIYERDLAVHLELITDNDQLIFLNENTDPYWFNSQYDNNLNEAVQQTIENTIGNAGYDVGILFSAQAGGGNAGDIASVCNNDSKGSAYAGSSQAGAPEGYFYAMTIAHEIGHQFGANHTFSRTEFTGVNMEPGSGTTIMGYAGYTAIADVQPLPDDEFHAASIFQISNFIKNFTACGNSTPIANSVPVIDNMQNYYIPIGTPFKLSGSATDIDGDVLTYSWEQVDSNDPWLSGVNPSGNFEYPSSTSTYLPSFRVYPPTTNPVQYFPPFEEVLQGSLFSTWNMLPVVERELNFALQVRDNSPLGGQTMADQMTVFVEGNTGPFQITSIQKNQTLEGGVNQTLAWDVNGTDSANINVSNVRILGSFDGGESFDVLVANTLNDGQEDITLPVGEVDEAYIMIEAIGNIFYAVSPLFSIDKTASIDCLTVETSSVIPVNLPTSFNQKTNYPIVVNQTGIIEDINLKLEFSNVGAENLLIGLLSPSNEGSYFYLGNCEGRADMKFTFDQEGESMVNNCGDLNGQRVEPPVGNFEDFYGLPMNGTWQLVLSYVELVEGSVETGGQLLSAELEFCSRTTTPLSIGNFDKSTLKIYPNPATHLVNFNYDRASGEPVELELYDLSGKKILQKEYPTFNDLSSQGLSVSNLSNGIYLLKFKEGNREIIKKLIVQ